MVNQRGWPLARISLSRSDAWSLKLTQGIDLPAGVLAHGFKCYLSPFGAAKRPRLPEPAPPAANPRTLAPLHGNASSSDERSPTGGTTSLLSAAPPLAGLAQYPPASSGKA